MIAVKVSVMAIAVVMQASENDGTAGTAAGRSAEGIAEECAVSCQAIHVGGYGCGVSIATHGGALVVSNKKDDIFICALKGQGNKKPECDKQSVHQCPSILPCTFQEGNQICEFLPRHGLFQLIWHEGKTAGAEGLEICTGKGLGDAKRHAQGKIVGGLSGE